MPVAKDMTPGAAPAAPRLAASVRTVSATTVTPSPVIALPAREDSPYLAQADAPPCPNCGSITVRNGACYKCLNCGTTTGCS